MSGDFIRGALIGGSQSGKTSLAVSFSKWLWQHRRMPSLVFDIFKDEHNWGPQARVFDRMEVFEAVVFKVSGFAVFWDEGTSTGGRDRENVKFFTQIRHNHSAFFFIGHSHATMLPLMRQNLTDAYLFRRDYGDAKEWAATLTDSDILRATELDQYQYLHKRAFRPVGICAPTFAQIERGVSP